MQQSKQVHRNKGERRDSSKVKPKFQEQRELQVKAKPLIPMNPKQEKYMELLQTKPVVVATGYAGTSKTYVPLCMAADAFRLGTINKIIVTRPAISSSKSVGFFTGSHTEKMSVWLAPVVAVLRERLGSAVFQQALDAQDIEFLPLEVVKGLSINNAFMMVEESSDLAKEEVIKLITRMGKNSTLVLAGDIRQAELKEDSGLSWLTAFITKHGMTKHFGWVDFNETSDIVRSEMVKAFIVAMVRDENEANNKKKGKL